MARARKEVNIWDVFWRLIVLKEVNPKLKYHRRFKCKCQCWNNKEVDLSVLWKSVNSCWCILKDSNKTHWMSNTRFYRIYKWIETRTTKKWYKNYSDRWIKNEWESFEDFYKDMYSTYKEWLTIDRINNDWNYCKENCRWATYKEQWNNTRANLYLEYQWRTQSLRLWCDELWLKYQRIRDRIKKYKWSVKKAFETP